MILCLRNTSIGAVILSIIACVPEQTLYIEGYSCVRTPGGSLVNIIPKSAHSRTYFWARRRKNCALTYSKQLLKHRFSLDGWFLLVGSLGKRCFALVCPAVLVRHYLVVHGAGHVGPPVPLAAERAAQAGPGALPVFSLES